MNGVACGVSEIRRQPCQQVVVVNWEHTVLVPFKGSLPITELLHGHPPLHSGGRMANTTPTQVFTAHDISEQMSSRSAGNIAMSLSYELEGYIKRLDLYRNKTQLLQGHQVRHFISA